VWQHAAGSESRGEPDLARLLARLANVPGLILFDSEDAAAHSSYGIETNFDAERLLKEGLEATAFERCSTIPANASGFFAATMLARASRGSGVAFVRIGDDPKKPPLACAVLSRDDAFERARGRLLSAAVLVRAAAIAETDGEPNAMRRHLARAVLTLSGDGFVKSCDSAIRSITGRDPRDVVGLAFAEILEPRSRPRFRRHFEQARQLPTLAAVYSVLRPDGARAPAFVILTHARLGDHEAFLCHMRELSSSEAAREIVGKLTITILPETGTTIRADRLLAETAEALDLRLVGVGVPVEPAVSGRAATRFELAAGSAVHRLDALARLAPPYPWDAALDERRVLIQGIPKDPTLAHAAELAALDIQGFVSVPLLAPDHTPLGVLVALSDSPTGFTTHEVESLKIIGEFLATDLDRQRAERALERRAAELAALLDATRDLTALREPDELLQDVVQRAVDLFPNADSGILFFEEGGYLVSRFERGFPLEANAQAFRVPIATTYLGQIFRSQRGHLLTPQEMREDLNSLPAAAERLRRAKGPDPVPFGVLGVPITAGGVTVGVLTVGQLAPHLPFQQRDLELLERFGGLAAAAIVQVRLFEAVRLRSALVEAMREAVFSLTADGSIGFANEGTHSMFAGNSAIRERGSVALLFDPSEAETISSALSAVRTSGHWVGFLKGRRGADSFDAAAALSRVAGSNEIVAIVSDVTERRQLEARALQAKTVDSLGKLAAGLAHDFNNHLGSIVGLATLLRSKLPADSALVEHIAGIETVAEQAAELARRLLVLGRTAPGVRVVTELNSIVSGIVDVLRHTFDPSIEIGVHLASSACYFVGDETAMRQALLNLATNARDAMPRGGKITLTTSIEAMDGDRPRVVVEVADTGVGMPPEVLRRLYEPFFTTKPQGKGTGLGCAIVFATVRAHGGTIDCSSRPGEGTRFRLSFPSAERAQAPRKITEPTELLRGTGTVLVVEDEPTLRRVTSDMLATLGYEAIPVPGGREALEVLRAQGSAVDVVLLDLTMPGMSGEEVFAAMQASDPGTRIVITTGYAAGNAADALLARGALALLKKPYRVHELARVMAEAIRAPKPEQVRELM